jgi:hypothetical protein
VTRSRSARRYSMFASLSRSVCFVRMTVSSWLHATNSLVPTRIPNFSQKARFSSARARSPLHLKTASQDEHGFSLALRRSQMVSASQRRYRASVSAMFRRKRQTGSHTILSHHPSVRSRAARRPVWQSQTRSALGPFPTSRDVRLEPGSASKRTSVADEPNALVDILDAEFSPASTVEMLTRFPDHAVCWRTANRPRQPAQSTRGADLMPDHHQASAR